MFIIYNAVPGIDFRSLQNSYSRRSACSATTIYAYSATDFVLVFFCYFMIFYATAVLAHYSFPLIQSLHLRLHSA